MVLPSDQSLFYESPIVVFLKANGSIPPGRLWRNITPSKPMTQKIQHSLNHPGIRRALLISSDRSDRGRKMYLYKT